MKLVHADQDRFVFKLSPDEKRVLLDILKLYPCVPPAHHRLSREDGDDAQAERQRLLDESVVEQRARNKRQVQTLLKHPGTFQRENHAWRLTLRRGDFEWLLQVLNDVRVGSWIALGSPEDLPRQLPADPQQARHACAMELAGLFQTMLIETVESHSGL